MESRYGSLFLGDEKGEQRSRPPIMEVPYDAGHLPPWDLIWRRSLEDDF